MVDVANKRYLSNIECPFVAHSGGYFCVVYQVDSDKIHFLRNGNKLSVTSDNILANSELATILAAEKQL